MYLQGQEQQRLTELSFGTQNSLAPAVVAKSPSGSMHTRLRKVSFSTIDKRALMRRSGITITSQTTGLGFEPQRALFLPFLFILYYKPPAETQRLPFRFRSFKKSSGAFDHSRTDS